MQWQRGECRHLGRNRCARRACSVCTIYKRYAVADMRMPAPGRGHVPGVHAEYVLYVQAICSGKDANAGTTPQRCARRACRDACKLYAANSNAQASGEGAPSNQASMARGGPHKQSSKNGASTPKWACPHPQLRLAIILWPFRLGSTETKILSKVCSDKWKLE